MKFDQPAGINPIDQLKVVGRPTDRIDGPLKVSGHAPYAYERHDVVANQAYGYILGSAVAKGRITHMDTRAALAAPGVVTVLTTLEFDKPLPLGMANVASLFGGAEVAHYHQAIAVVVAETFEQARAAAALILTDYERAPGRFDLAAGTADAQLVPADDPTQPAIARTGDFAAAFAAAPVKIDQHYTTPDESHAMMEPFATIAAWEGEKVTLWTSNQMIAWSKASFAKILSIKPENVRLDSPFIGGGFGGKLFVRADAVCAALAAKKAGRPVKIAMQRPLMMNNSTHRPATIQHIRLGAARDGRLTAIGHSSTSGNLPGGDPEGAIAQTRLFYAAPNRETFMNLARLDLPEGNAMRAPGEAPGLMALEVAMDELAEALGMDPVELRILNDTQVDPERPDHPFSERHYVECLRTGADRFGWAKRKAKPGQVRDGKWMIGMGMAGGFRGNILGNSAARIRLESSGKLVVETDMTDIGTGTYTILAQTTAEMMGVTLADVTVRLGDSDFPPAAGSGGQWGANNSTAGLYAACLKLRAAVAQALGLDPAAARFADGRASAGGRGFALADAARAGPLTGEDGFDPTDMGKRWQQATYAAHFAEVAVDSYTGETRIRRMLAVADAGRILNPKAARSQMIGAMTMGAGAALSEEMAVDKRFGLFINHDLAGYEVPVHADIPHQEVIFLDHPDDKSSPMKAKGVGELGLCGVGAAIANAIYNATGIRVRDYPLTLDKYLDRLPVIA